MSDEPLDTTAAWDALGIAPTDDQRAIRRAYAVRLKAIDVEADLRAFVALREAYDAVRMRTAERPASLADPSPDEAPVVATAQVEGGERAIRATAAEIVALLDGDVPLAAIEEPLADLTLRLIVEGETATIDLQDETEQWLVETIADAIPRSDAMVRPAVAQYRWHLRRHGEPRPDRASILIDRMRDLNFAEIHVLREGGRHHLAYLTLQDPPVTGFMRRPDIAALASLPPFFREVGEEPRVATVTFDEDVVEQWHKAVRRYHLAIDHWNAAQRTGWSRNVRRAMATFMWLFAIAVIAALFFVFSLGPHGVGATPPPR